MQNLSTINPPSEMELGLRKRDQVSHEARRRLDSSGYRELGVLSCDYHEGVLFLRGTVSCFYHKQLAQEIVKQTPEIEVVMNLIEVQSIGSERVGY